VVWLSGIQGYLLSIIRTNPVTSVLTDEIIQALID
jgi:hypothetical protein